MADAASPEPFTWVPDPAGEFARSRPVVCPVNDLLWLRLAELGASQPASIIVQVHADESAPYVAALLRARLQRGGIIVYADYFSASVDFDQLVTVLLPLTSWAGFVRRASAALQRLATHQNLVSATSRRNEPVDWSAEDSRMLRWLTRYVTIAHRFELPEPRADAFPVPHVVAELLAESAANAAVSEARPVLAARLNRSVEVAVRDSRQTVKVDATERLFEVSCADVLWAVVDTGIDRDHEAFASSTPAMPASRIVKTYDIPRAIAATAVQATTFTPLLKFEQWRDFAIAADVTAQPQDLRYDGLREDHGTHVAGILGANAPSAAPSDGKPWPEHLAAGEIKGMCPDIQIIDVRVFDAAGNADEFSVMIALGLIKWMNDTKMVATDVLGPGRRVDGVNLSLSVPFSVEDHACGWTPVCELCDQLVNAGVVVVAAAGNAGFVESQDHSKGAGFRLASITDPGNAEAVITVGATNSHQPYRQGPLARSSKGPTADGRHKPDVLAPGESIVGPAAYGGWKRETGTSQATAHVSGAAAILLARFPELRGQPQRVKQILTASASDLGRLPDFQGRGLLDVLRAMQST